MSSDAPAGAADYFRYDETHLAADVSDYVSGRLDPLAMRDMEQFAKINGRVAAAIVTAASVRQRVAKRLALKS